MIGFFDNSMASTKIAVTALLQTPRQTLLYGYAWRLLFFDSFDINLLTHVDHV